MLTALTKFKGGMWYATLILLHIILKAEPHDAFVMRRVAFRSDAVRHDTSRCVSIRPDAEAMFV